jgi:hypothetical protein
MNRRKFIVNTGAVSIALLGTSHTASSLLHAGVATDSETNLRMEEKP